MSFFVAMQNWRTTASYWQPETVVSERSEFLIVARSGERNQFLSIASAGTCLGSETEAPPRLSPDLAILATLVSRGVNGGELFLVERELPGGAAVQGHLVSGDGYVLLHEDRLCLTGAVRLRPGAGTRPVGDCVLLAANEPGATVHLKARYVPWCDELLPPGFIPRANEADRPR